MTTTIAITGIGGFIGTRMAERALALGWRVQGLELSPIAAERTRALGAIVTVGDINDASAVRHALAGADCVFHTAAIVEEDGDRADYERVNVEGTRTVCRSASDAGVRRFIHLSSVMVYGFDYPQDVDENGPLDGQGNVYNDTKLASEQVALSHHSLAGMRVVVIRPGDVYGHASVPWVLRPIDLLRRRLFVLPDFGRGVINHVHVDNLLDGVLLALDKMQQSDAVAGQAFTISDGVATPCRDFFAYHARMAGKPLPLLPTWTIAGFLRASAPVWRLLGQKPPASPAGVQFLLRRHRYDISKAQRMLGYQPRITLAEGMAEIAARHAR